MKKRVISLLLCLLMALSLIPTAAFASDVATQDKNPKPETHGFGYDAYSESNEGQPIKGLKSISVGTTVLAQRNTSATTTNNAATNGITITLEPGYYVSHYRIVCGDKYNCRTDQQGKSFRGGEFKPVNGSASVTLNPPIKNAFSHTSNKYPYWLLLEVTADSTPYNVSYNWGNLANTIKTAAPATETHVVSDTVTVKAADQAALKEASDAGKVFAGWKLSLDDKIYQADNQFIMPNHNVTLTAQWTDAPITTNKLTIQKVVEGDVDVSTKTFSFTITNTKGGNPYTVTITGANKAEITVPVGNYLVTEDIDAAKISGYKLTVTGSGTTVDVTGSSSPTVTVTNTYEKQEQEPETGTLVIKKVLTDNAPDAAKNMNFKFKILDEDGNQWGDIITITGADSRSISVPVGNYTVVELEEDAQISGYILNTTTVYGEPTGVSIQSNDPDVATDTPKAVVEKNKTTEVTVTNKYELLPPETGKLTITKYIYDENNSDTYPEYDSDTGNRTIKVPFKAPNDATYRFVVTGTVGGQEIKRVANIEIKKGETFGSATIDNLPYGEYTVTEGYSDIRDKYPDDKYPDLLDGYTCCACIIGPMTADDEVGFVEKNDDLVVVIGEKRQNVGMFYANGYTTYASLTVTKNVTGVTLTEDKTYYFKVEVRSVDDNNKETWDTIDYIPVTVLKGNTSGSSTADYYYPGTYRVTEVVSGTIPWDNNTTIKVDANLSGYTLSETKAQIITITDTTESNDVTVSFTNAYTLNTNPGPGPKPRPTPNPKPVTSVKTGDMGIALYAMTSLLSLGGTALVIKKRKDEE